MPWLKATDSERIPSGVESGMIPPADQEAWEADRAALRRRAGPQVAADAKLFLMVQRIAPEKGTSAALDAVAHLRDAGGSVHLVIAGDGPSRAPLAEGAAARGLPVTFIGTVKHSELPSLYHGADAFVSCSRSETYGLSIAEALSCGTPAVIPKHPVFDELWAAVVPSEWRYDPNGGVAAVAAAMLAAAAGRKYLADHPVKCSWSDGAQELVRQYDKIMGTQGLPKIMTSLVAAAKMLLARLMMRRSAA